MKRYFNDKLIHDATIHAKEEYPRESCGLFIDDKYVRCENIYEDPNSGFRIDKHEILKAYQSNFFQAVIHSHCDTERVWASGEDIKRQEAMGVPWGVIDLFNKSVREVFFWGDQLPIQDLLGRPFIHGVYDCYSLARDYYRLKDILLPNFPRDWGWWKKGENTLLDNLEKSGFKLINPKELEPDDGIIGKIKFKHPNHCGIYLDEGLILHHWSGKNSLSCEVPYNIISKYIIYGARYVE